MFEDVAAFYLANLALAWMFTSCVIAPSFWNGLSLVREQTIFINFGPISLSWVASGLQAQLESRISLRFLAFVHQRMMSRLVSATTVWVVAQLFAQDHLMETDSAKLTEAGVGVVANVARFALILWYLI